MNEASNGDHLRGHFVERLLRESPRSVLDVGCGGGQLLARLRARGVTGVGVEVKPAALAEARRAGLEVRESPAVDLPFDDGALDFVSIRHVLHHLADPAAALREALRVARRGLLVAEPWFAPDVPSQRVALAIDTWLKAHDRRRGRTHHPNLGAAEILGLLPAELREVDLEVHLRLRARSIADFAEESASRLDDLPPTDAAHTEAATWREAIVTTGWSWNGSLLLAIRAAR